jgi:hypothetical protein
MAHAIRDRVKEETATTGTGTLTLGGAVSGFRTFAAAVGSGNTCYYACVHRDTAEWEIGIGTVGASTLARTTVLESSNANALVSFTSGNKDVFVTAPAVALEAGLFTYTHTQVSAAATWTVTHNLNRRPSVTVVDSGDTVVIGDVNYVSDNQLTLTFSAAFSGKAHLN